MTLGLAAAPTLSSSVPKPKAFLTPSRRPVAGPPGIVVGRYTFSPAPCDSREAYEPPLDVGGPAGIPFVSVCDNGREDT